MTRPTPPELLLDANADGVVGTGDVGAWAVALWGWVNWVFFAPGDAVLVVVIVEFTDVADRFAMTTAWYGGRFSGVVSLVVWGISLLSIALWLRRGRDRVPKG